MNSFKKTAAAALCMTMLAGAVSAQTWTLNAENSNLSYGSIKKDTVGEVNSFTGLSGTVTEDGKAMIEIDLTSLETWIDIRNERMAEYIFQNTPKATMSAQLDMSEFNALAVGTSTLTDIEATLSLMGNDVPLEAEMFVTRSSETQAIISTNGMIFVKTEDLGVNAGIDKLMELAKLPGITRTVPITVRFVFDSDGEQASAAPSESNIVQVAAVDGDPKKGKRIFRKCSACHSLDEGENGSGPTLHGIFGKTAGSNPDFRFSQAMQGSGITWDVETLSAFLAKPRDLVKGTSMAFPGLKKETEIANVLAYIQSES